MAHVRTAAALALMLAACGCGGRSPDPGFAAAPWVRLPAVPGRPGAAYFAITGGSAPTRLMAVATPAAMRVELHESMAGMAGMTIMRPLGAVDVPAGATVRFAPGGRHAMLFGIDPRLAPRGTTSLELRFANGFRLLAPARVVAAGDPAPE